MGTVTTIAELTHQPPAAAAAPHFDEKWKLSRKESSSRSCRTSSNSSSFVKASSNSSQKRCAFSRKCARLVKEQRARFYIMRRCVTMLVCWHE